MTHEGETKRQSQDSSEQEPSSPKTRKARGNQNATPIPAEAYPHKIGSLTNFYDLYGRFLIALHAYANRKENGDLEVPDENAAIELSGLYEWLNLRIFHEHINAASTGTNGQWDRRKLGQLGPLYDAVSLIRDTFRTSIHAGGTLVRIDRRIKETRFKPGEAITYKGYCELRRAYKILGAYVDYDELRDHDERMRERSRRLRSLGSDSRPARQQANKEGGRQGAKLAHAIDFAWVKVRRCRFEFSRQQQRLAVKLLYEHWCEADGIDGAGVSEATIREQIGSSADRFRMAKLFDAHPALHDLIGRVSPGIWALYVNSKPKPPRVMRPGMQRKRQAPKKGHLRGHG